VLTLSTYVAMSTASIKPANASLATHTTGNEERRCVIIVISASCRELSYQIETEREKSDYT
jgi:hypothetical protein